MIKGGNLLVRYLRTASTFLGGDTQLGCDEFLNFSTLAINEEYKHREWERNTYM